MSGHLTLGYNFSPKYHSDALLFGILISPCIHIDINQKFFCPDITQFLPVWHIFSEKVSVKFIMHFSTVLGKMPRNHPEY